MAKFNYGDRVLIMDVPGQIKEFAGKTGTVVGTAWGIPVYYRIRMDEPVDIPGLGRVTDDLWTKDYIKKVK